MKIDRTIVIVGGAAGALIANEIFSSQYKKVMFLETYAKKISKAKIVAPKITEGLNFITDDKVDYFIATGDNKQRETNFNIIYRSTKKLPVNCIHDTAFISPSSKVGYGNLICAKSVININAIVGNNTIINTGAIVEHDCRVEDFAQISPNTTLCGYVKVGAFAFVGAGSVIIPKVKIGKNSIVGAGSAVIKNVEHDKMYAGVPAVFKKNII